MKTHIFRLTYGQDLKQEIINYQKEHHIQAGYLATCVGCVYEVGLRLADGQTKVHLKGRYEIVSLCGTLAQNGVHLHISLSDEEGKTIGGHLIDGCLVNTTAEIVLVEVDDVECKREFDAQTGYDELVVSNKLFKY